VTGALIITVGWLYFNGGKTLNLFVPRANAPAKILMNTIISGCVSGVFAVYLKPHFLGTYSHVTRYDCVALCGGFITGLVSVSGCVDHIEAWGAFAIGLVASIVYIAGCKLLDKLHIDDPVEGAPIYLFGGIWGTIATGFFDNKKGLFYAAPNCGQFFGY
jgi:Amt family ammonium transporter